MIFEAAGQGYVDDQEEAFIEIIILIVFAVLVCLQVLLSIFVILTRRGATATSVDQFTPTVIQKN
jgi:GTP:adenosylcobinamide-phosphate guanylyltransferase